MSAKSKIEWTEATWSPVRGCTKVSHGCTHCYAERMAARFCALPDNDTALCTDFPVRNDPPPFYGFVDPRTHRWTGRVELIESQLDIPLRWRKPRRIFVCSMSDWAHESLPDTARDRIFAVMRLADWHEYMLLTKRPANALRYLTDPETPLRVAQVMDCIQVDLDMAGIPESWLPIPGYSGEYEVSNYGQVRSLKFGKIQVLAQSFHGGGYRQVALCSNGSPKTALVHVLVLEAFRGPRPSVEESRHRNRIRSDNRIANLSWGTKTDNMQDSARHGTAGVWMKSQAGMDQKEVDEIRKAHSAGETQASLHRRLGRTRQQISAICLGKIFRPPELTWPLPNVLVGVSVEDQATADERIPLLLQTPAAVRFISLEPMLGPVELRDYLADPESCDGCGGTHPLGSEACHFSEEHPGRFRGLDWVICGGESGPGARPCSVEWIRSVVRQCRAAGVPAFVKQLGSHAVDTIPNLHGDLTFRFTGAGSKPWGKGGDPEEWPPDLRVRQLPEVIK